MRLNNKWFYLVVTIGIVTYFSLFNSKVKEQAVVYADYNEECVQEGCSNHEVWELYQSYRSECINENCSKHEVHEIVGGTSSALLSETRRAFTNRGWETNSRDFESPLSCEDGRAHPQTGQFELASCAFVVLICYETCRYSDGIEDRSYACGACFGTIPDHLVP